MTRKIPITRFCTLTLLVLLTLIAGSPHLSSVDAAPELQTTGSVSGTVYQSNGSTPIENAEVCASTHPYGDVGYGCATTDSNGDYTISGIPDGETVRLDARADGYATEFYNNVPYLGDHSNATPVTVSASTPQTGINFSLDPGGSISGTVYASGGSTPLEGVPVDTAPWGGFGQCTDANGQFTMDGLPQNTDIFIYAGGAAWGSCSADGTYAKEYYNGKTELNNADAIVLTSGTPNATGKDFFLIVGGSISGTVTVAGSSTPIPDINVCVNTYYSDTHIACVQSQADGTYQLGGLQAGDYRVDAGGPGYIWEVFDNHLNWDDADPVSVSPPDETPNINFALEPGAVIAGTVYESNGLTPIENAEVCIQDYPWGNGYGCYWTQADGSYYADGIPDGATVRLDARADGYAQELYNNMPYLGDHNNATPVNASVSTPQMGINFSLDPGGTISGTVRGPGGTPLSGVPLDVVPWGGFGQCTDVNGNYTMSGLPQDTNIYIYAGGSAWGGCSEDGTYTRQYYNGKSNQNDADPIVLTSGTPNATGKDFTLTIGGTITGTVVQEGTTTPIGGANVYVEDFNTGQWLANVQSNPDGTYALGGLSTGTYKVGAQGTGWAMEYYNNGLRYEADPVNVTAGLTTPNINFSLAPGGTIAGRVTDEVTGLGISNIVVDASFNQWGHGTCTDANGYYYLENLPLGEEFRVQANRSTWCSGPNNYVGEFYNDQLNWNNAQVFNLTFATKDQSNINFALVEGGSISGRVTDEISGVGLNNADICVTEYDTGSYRSCYDNLLNPDGTYVFGGLPPGDYRVNVEDVPGHVPEYYNNANWGTATRVTVTAGANTPNIDFPLAPAGTVTGRVIDQSTGQPIANMIVRSSVVAPDYPETTTCTDSNGYYTLDGVPFDLDFRVASGGWNHCEGGTWKYAQEWWQNVYYGMDATLLQITAANPTKSGINFALAEGGSITVTVYAEDGVTPLSGVPVDTDPIIFATCTESDGTITLEALPLNQPLIIHAGGGGWWGCDKQDYIREWWEDSPTYEGATPITLTGITPHVDAEFTLTLGGKISGTVYDTDGTTPLGGANLWMFDVTNNNWFGAGQTEPDGTYSIQWLADSTYNLAAGKDGYANEYYNDAQPGDTIYDFVVASGSTFPNTNFTLGPEGTVSGTVYDKDGGTPLENIYVGVEDFMWPGACTAADGTYTIGHLPQGAPLKVYAGGDDYCGGNSALYNKEWWQETPDKASATTVTLSPSQSGIDFTLETSAVPVLVAPENGVVLATRTPTLEWQPIPGLTQFNLQVANSDDFASPLISTSRTGTTFTPPLPGLGQGEWFWRMRVRLPDNSWSDWSEVWSFTVDTLRPAAPILIAPQNGSTEATDTPTFDWDPVTDAVGYTIQRDTSNYFNSANFMEETVEADQFTPATPMSDAKWYWRVQAVDAAGNLGLWSSTWNFVLDSVPTPAPLLIAPVDGLITNDRTPTFEWEAVVDVDRYEIQVDNDLNFGSPLFTTQRTTLTYTPLVGMGNGDWYWHVRARGLDGNWGFWSDPWTLTIDTIAPTRPTLFAPAYNETVDVNQPTFQWDTVADANNYQIQIDASQYFNTANRVDGYSNTEQFIPDSALVDQPWYWRVRAIDVAGNVGPWSVVWRVYIDAVPTPVPNLIAPTNETLTNDRTPTFDWDDPVGVVRYNLVVDDDPNFGSPRVNVSPTVSIYTPNLTPLADGIWYWHVRALGADGNWSDFSESWYVEIDATRPGRPILIDPASGSETGNNTPTFTWTNPGDAVNYRIQIDRNIYFNTAELVEGYSNTLTWTPGTALTDGRWYWRVQATDAGGNVGPWSVVFNFFIDAVPTPVPTLIAPEKDLLTRDRVFTFNWSAEDGVKLYNIQVDNEDSFAAPYRVNANVTANTFRNGALPLGHGTWYWRVRAQGTDNIWGDWSEAWMIEVDLLRPDRPVQILPANGEVVDTTSSPTFTWSALTDAVEYTLQIDRDSYFRSADKKLYQVIGTNTYTIPDELYDGNWYWRVAALDEAGNQSYWSSTWRVFVDAVPTPTPTLVAPTYPLTNQSVHTFEWTAEEGVKRYNFQVDNEESFTAPMRINVNVTTNSIRNGALPLGTGIWHWRVRAQGTDGQWGEWTSHWTFEVDRVRPTRPTLTSPANGSTTANNMPTFTWDPSLDADVVGYIIQIDRNYLFTSPEKIQQTVAVTSYTPDTALVDRRWFWRVAAVDAAGNVGPYTGYWTVIVDATTTSSATMTIESDSPEVQRAGQWKRNTAAVVSGGSYLASKDASASLSLTFTGSQIEVQFVKHATLGALAIEVDGQVIQVIDCSAVKTMKLAQVKLAVAPGQHTVRVVPMNGSIVIDAFVITP